MSCLFGQSFPIFLQSIQLAKKVQQLLDIVASSPASAETARESCQQALGYHVYRGPSTLPGAGQGAFLAGHAPAGK